MPASQTPDQPQTKPRKFNSLQEFYPFYLSEHQNTTNRFLHFTGIALFCLCFVAAMLFHNVIFFILMLIVCWLFAWIGHLFFEKNKPSTFTYPFFTFACDFLLFGDVIMGRQSFKAK